MILQFKPYCAFLNLHMQLIVRTLELQWVGLQRLLYWLIDLVYRMDYASKLAVCFVDRKPENIITWKEQH